MPLPVLKPKRTKLSVKAESEELEESVEEEQVDPLDGVEDVDEVQEIAQDIFDKEYKLNRRKYSSVASSYPPNTHIFIRVMDEGNKKWVPLVFGKDNKASDMALAVVMKQLADHDFKVSYRAQISK